MSIISLVYVHLSKIVIYSCNLTYLNNLQKFQLNLMRTFNFLLKLFDTIVTLKQGHGHWKWHEQVKLNEQYHHAMSNIYQIYSLQENCNVKVFAMQGNHLASQTLIITQTHKLYVFLSELKQKNKPRLEEKHKLPMVYYLDSIEH